MRLELQEVERQQLHVKQVKKHAEKEEDDRFRQEVSEIINFHKSSFLYRYVMIYDRLLK